MKINMPMYHTFIKTRCGVTLLECIVAISIIGVLVLVAIPRVDQAGRTAKLEACRANVGDINIQTALWLRDNGAWPSTDLSDIGGDVHYFPDGIPVCPVDGSAYVIDSETGAAEHSH